MSLNFFPVGVFPRHFFPPLRYFHTFRKMFIITTKKHVKYVGRSSLNRFRPIKKKKMLNSMSYFYYNLFDVFRLASLDARELVKVHCWTCYFEWELTREVWPLMTLILLLWNWKIYVVLYPLYHRWVVIFFIRRTFANLSSFRESLSRQKFKITQSH